MKKSAILGLFLAASLIMGTSASINLFSPATAMVQGMAQYDNNNNYQSTYEKDPYANSYGDNKMSNYQSTYEKDPYANSYGDNKMSNYQSTYGNDESYANSYSNSYNYDKKQQPSYDKSYDKSSYSKNSYGDQYNDHKDKVKEYECKKGPFKGFFTSSVEFCINAKHDDRKHNR